MSDIQADHEFARVRRVSREPDYKTSHFVGSMGRGARPGTSAPACGTCPGGSHSAPPSCFTMVSPSAHRIRCFASCYLEGSEESGERSKKRSAPEKQS